jgi:quercetin dioxygenase-like cupin family protein
MDRSNLAPPTIGIRIGMVFIHKTGVRRNKFQDSLYFLIHRAKGEATMEIKRSGSQPSAKGPVQYFSGEVRIDPLFEPPAPARSFGASVTFESGARTAWHTHPLGQILIVTAGCGWTQCWGEPKEEIRPGDVVWCPPDKKHWHGATSTTAMSHIALVEKLDGKGVDWLEKVSDEQYLSNK